MKKLVYTFVLLLTLFIPTVLLVGCSTGAGRGQETPGRTVSERLIGKGVYNNTYYAVSPDLKRLAYVKIEGEKKSVVVDGVEGKQYEGIESLIFSPDSQHLGYLARIGGKTYAVIDGAEGEHYAYDEIDRWHSAATKYYSTGVPLMTESPDGKRVAALNSNHTAVIIDGVEGKQYLGGISSIVFSPDSKRVVYIAHPPDRLFQLVVENGVESNKYLWSEGKGWASTGEAPTIKLVFSPDSQRLAYVAIAYVPKVGWKPLVVLDGVEGKQYDSINNLTFTSDSRHVVYLGSDLPDKQDPLSIHWYVVVDGTERKYDMVLSGKTGKIVFDSSDTLHYMAVKGNDIYLVEEQLR